MVTVTESQTDKSTEKTAPELSWKLALALRRDLEEHRRKMVTCRLSKSQAAELLCELEALWVLFHDAQRMAEWLAHLLPLCKDDAALQFAVESQICSARQRIERIRQSRRA